MAEYCRECGSIMIMPGICSNKKLHDPEYRAECELRDKRKYGKAYKSDRPVIQDYVSERNFRGA